MNISASHNPPCIENDDTTSSNKLAKDHTNGIHVDILNPPAL